MGGFFTSMMSPGLMVRAGFTEVPPMDMRPFLQASAAMVRVLNMRAAHNHLSIRASSFILSLVVLVHGDVNPCQAEAFYDISR